MTSVDELFKKPQLPAGQKRKLEANKNPTEIYKAAKLDPNDDVKSNGRATVEDDLSDEEAGPSRPPDDDQEEGPDDDEDGRFFGGGITRDTANVLDFIDENELDEDAPEKIDSAWLRKLALNFEKRISKNAELRAKFETEPQKFMGSEADLDADIKALSILSEHPDLYWEFAKLGCAGSLVSLLAHENTDIAIDSIEIINELTDEDVEAEESQWRALVDSMIESDLLDLLFQNLARLDETTEADRGGVYHILSVLENLSSQTSLAEQIGNSSSLLVWLLERIRKPESPLSQNKQYAAEILAILLQSSPKNRERFIATDGIDLLLQLLSAYRKRDPAKDTEEEEYVENLFDALTCTVDEDEGKERFIDGEGMELCLIMLREGKMAKSRALRVLDHALSGPGGASTCERFVDAAGLKTVFGMFMKKQESQTAEHLLGIFASMLRLLPGQSAARIRLLAKFVEKDFEKVDKLVKLRREYAARMSSVDMEIERDRAQAAEEVEEMEPEWLSRRMDAGLFSLQTIDVILAWLIAEDDGAKTKIKSLFADRDESIQLLKVTLQEQLSALQDDEESDRNSADMLNTLLRFL